MCKLPFYYVGGCCRLHLVIAMQAMSLLFDNGSHQRNHQAWPQP